MIEITKTVIELRSDTAKHPTVCYSLDPPSLIYSSLLARFTHNQTHTFTLRSGTSDDFATVKGITSIQIFSLNTNGTAILNFSFNFVKERELWQLTDHINVKSPSMFIYPEISREVVTIE